MANDEASLVKRIAGLNEELASLEKSEQQALAELGRTLLFVADEMELDDNQRKSLSAAQEAYDACGNMRARIAEAKFALEELEQAKRQGPRVCPKCHAEILPGDVFCTGCGTKVSDLEFPAEAGGVCPQCKSPVEPDMKFCPKCGTSLCANS